MWTQHSDIKMKQTQCYFTTINIYLVFIHILGFVPFSFKFFKILVP